jgi:hypothetical protein
MHCHLVVVGFVPPRSQLLLILIIFFSRSKLSGFLHAVFFVPLDASGGGGTMHFNYLHLF